MRPQPLTEIDADPKRSKAEVARLLAEVVVQAAHP